MAGRKDCEVLWPGGLEHGLTLTPFVCDPSSRAPGTPQEPPTRTLENTPPTRFKHSTKYPMCLILLVENLDFLLLEVV